MTREEYRRICDRVARKAIRYAELMAEEDAPGNVTSEREHWIDVYLDEHLPDIDADVVLAVTSHPDAPAKSGYSPFQADVWDALNRMDQQRGDPNWSEPGRDADGEPGNVSE